MTHAFAPLQLVSHLARKLVAGRQASPDTLGRWSVLYIDPNGQLQKVVADVQGYAPHDRTVLLQAAPRGDGQGGQGLLRVKLNRIAEAVEVHSGRRVLLDRWVSFVTRRGALAS